MLPFSTAQRAVWLASQQAERLGKFSLDMELAAGPIAYTTTRSRQVSAVGGSNNLSAWTTSSPYTDDSFTWDDTDIGTDLTAQFMALTMYLPQAWVDQLKGSTFWNWQFSQWDWNNGTATSTQYVSPGGWSSNNTDYISISGCPYGATYNTIDTDLLWDDVADRWTTWIIASGAASGGMAFQRLEIWDTDTKTQLTQKSYTVSPFNTSQIPDWANTSFTVACHANAPSTLSTPWANLQMDLVQFGNSSAGAMRYASVWYSNQDAINLDSYPGSLWCGMNLAETIGGSRAWFNWSGTSDVTGSSPIIDHGMRPCRMVGRANGFTGNLALSTSVPEI